MQPHRTTPAKVAAGVIVVHCVAGQWQYLLLRAYRNWDFPKGGVEPGEEPLAAAIRETREETGIADLELAWGADHFDTGPYAGGKIARYYLARTRSRAVVLPVSPELGRPEHHEYRWLDFAAALELAPPRVKPVIAWAAAKLDPATILGR
jgi:8-oxo-dGTP pyrophosphatase MutT (NUDIX family)